MKKLGLKAGANACIINPPEKYFDAIAPLPEGVIIKNSFRSNLDFVHFFVTKQSEFKASLTSAHKHLQPDGMIWVSWPKKSSKVPSDLDEIIIRDFGLKSGLVDVKVCAVDDVWSGLKFVVPVKNRPPSRQGKK
ncbi:DUF3052 domain-containing protein [Chryseolinea sp. T2]|uniref:DUF3052 domain-containing protein n=1 Tax=Chryseolinea sp. T2 TaxID=3129255 RepID=UPI003077FE8C